VQRDLASQIEQTARSVEVKTAETARELNGKIELVERKTDLTITSKAHELTTRIDETAKQAVETTHETARGLTRQIEEAEKRAYEKATGEVTRQVEDLLQRSRKATGEMKDRLQALETMTGNLGKQLIDEASDRKAEQMAFRADLDGRIKAVLQQLQHLEQARREVQRALTEALHEARRRNAGLEARVAELEKPRGLWALWAWLVGRFKKAPAAEAEEPAAATAGGRDE
jgi:BMFP domain-containing protein YqiC